MSDPLIETAYQFYSNTRPDERRYLTWQMNHETAAELRRSSTKHMFPAPFCKEDDEKCWEQFTLPDQLFGRPVAIDNSLPKWTIVPDIETPEFRRVKEYAEQLPCGKTLNIMVTGPMVLPIDIRPPEIPTLRALARYWWKKAKEKLNGI